MPCVPPSVAHGHFKASPSCSPLAALATDDPWVEALEGFRARSPRRHTRIAAYEHLLESGRHRQIADDVLALRHRPAPPVEVWANKADGRKKCVFHYPAADESLFRC